MSVLNQIGLGKLNSGAATAEEQRIAELFRSRAELKKAYSELQDEIHRLKERLRHQEGATTRVQEILGQLEVQLEDRERGYSAIVFYQLRRLWQSGHDVIAAYAVDLEREHVERERRAFLVEFNRRQFARRQHSDTALTSAQRAAVDARATQRDLEHKIAQLNRPWHRFQRRDLEQRLPALRAAATATEQALVDARTAHATLLAEAEQGFAGLSVDARRIINLELIAAAEILCLRLIKSPLLALARAAATRREVGDGYGNRGDCDAMMEEIALAHAVIEQRQNFPADIRARAERLVRCVAYEKADDTVPLAESLVAPKPGKEAAHAHDPVIVALEKPIRDKRPPAAPEVQPPNVLIEDSWELFRLLLH